MQEVKADDVPTKPIERRRSKIFETAEKFQNLISSSDSKTAVGDKKLIIPGVSVGGFKKEFERKASLTSTSPPKAKAVPSKKIIIDQQSVDAEAEKEEAEENKVAEKENDKVEDTVSAKEEDPRKERVKNAVNIITSVLDKEGTRKSKSRPCMYRKPPVPFGAGGRSASGSIGLIPTPFSPTEEKHSFKLQVSFTVVSQMLCCLSLMFFDDLI